MLSPQEIAKKWAERLAASKASIRAGVNAVTESPTAKAARNVDKYRSGCLNAADNGTFVAGCNKVTVQQWKDKMLGKGLANLENGIKDGEIAQASFQTRAAPFYKAAKERAAAIEGTGRAAARAKVEAAWDVMEELRQANTRG